MNSVLVFVVLVPILTAVILWVALRSGLKIRPWFEKRPVLRNLLLFAALALNAGNFYFLAKSSSNAGAQIQVPDLVPYKAESGDFSVSFPGTPTVEKKSQAGVELLTVQVKWAKELNYSLFEMNYPGAPMDPKTALTNLRNELIKKSTPIPLISEKSTHVSGAQAHTMKFGNSNAGMRFLFVQKGTKIYQLSVGGRNRYIDDPKTDEFFKSFQLLK